MFKVSLKKRPFFLMIVVLMNNNSFLFSRIVMTSSCSFNAEAESKVSWHLLQGRLYEKNKLTNIEPQQEPKIPKIIHQIWLGGPLPEMYKGPKYQQSWLEHHPDWEYKLWTDEDVKDFELYNQKYFDDAKNYGERSDILRYEIIYKFGGLYIDTDFECLKPFDILHHCYDFYTGILPLDITGFLSMANGLLAATKGHPIIKHCIETIKNSADQNSIPTRTGPAHFDRAVRETILHCEGINIVFPIPYFYPLECKQKSLGEQDKKKVIWPESFAVHHWEASWLKPEAEVKTNS